MLLTQRSDQKQMNGSDSGDEESPSTFESPLCTRVVPIAPLLGRRLFFSHHIRSTLKRQLILRFVPTRVNLFVAVNWVRACAKFPSVADSSIQQTGRRAVECSCSGGLEHRHDSAFRWGDELSLGGYSKIGRFMNKIQ